MKEKEREGIGFVCFAFLLGTLEVKSGRTSTSSGNDFYVLLVSYMPGPGRYESASANKYKSVFLKWVPLIFGVRAVLKGKHACWVDYSAGMQSRPLPNMDGPNLPNTRHPQEIDHTYNPM